MYNLHQVVLLTFQSVAGPSDTGGQKLHDPAEEHATFGHSDAWWLPVWPDVGSPRKCGWKKSHNLRFVYTTTKEAIRRGPSSADCIMLFPCGRSREDERRQFYICSTAFAKCGINTWFPLL
jgi:hypothetical protein